MIPILLTLYSACRLLAPLAILSIGLLSGDGPVPGIVAASISIGDVALGFLLPRGRRGFTSRSGAVRVPPTPAPPWTRGAAWAYMLFALGAWIWFLFVVLTDATL